MTFCQNHPMYWDSLNQGAKIGTLGVFEVKHNLIGLLTVHFTVQP